MTKKIEEIDNNERVAIFGTGAHTSRLLGMTNLKEKNLVRFYDSDPKRNGLTMVGVEIKPFSLEDVKEVNVQTILISSFSSEKTLLDKLSSYSGMFKIIALYQ